ncbi:RICIN domain-containing protein [Streptomyces sp. NPDC056549]|uniref:RICIN domain-containing protein n=1 Tax=Streptomyces sp. NPDC056549 TaxID=3345864 RepID=UPI0036ACDF07
MSWAVGHTLYDGSSQLFAYESDGRGAYDITGCLTQNPGLIGKDNHQSWLSVEHCTYDMNQQWWFEPNTVGAQPHADRWSTPASGQIMSSAAQTCVSGGQADQVQLAQCADGKEQQWQARASVTAPVSGESASSAAAPAVPGSRTAAVRSARASLASDPGAAPVGAFTPMPRESGAWPPWRSTPGTCPTTRRTRPSP